MFWEEYRKLYYSCQLGLGETTVLTHVAGEVLKEFPTKLPRNLQEPLWRDIEKMLYGLRKATGGPIPENVKQAFKDLKQDEASSDLSLRALSMYLWASLLGYSSAEEIDFGRLLYSQQLVMLFVQLDAFIADSLRIICQLRPEVMKGDKKIDWDTVLECGGWEQLLDHLSEQYIFEFGWQSVRKRITLLRTRLGLVVECPEPDLELLEEAENIRNIVVHNGGRVNQEYIRRTGRDSLTVGAFVPLSLEYLDKIAQVTTTLASNLFVAVSKKFFHIEDSKLTGVWRRSGNPQTDLEGNGI